MSIDLEPSMDLRNVKKVLARLQNREPDVPVEVAPPRKLIKLDIGCGMNKQPGFVGTDCIAFPGVDVVTDLRKPWPWEDNSVEEAHASHVIEHFEVMERCHFVNELWRVLVPGGKATIIAPHWASCRAYGDPTHKWSAVSEFWFYYLSRDWRMGAELLCPACKGQDYGVGKKCDQCKGALKIQVPANAPHTDAKYLPGGFSCDFDATWGWSMHPALVTRNPEYQQEAFQWRKEAIQDVIATFVAKK